MKILYACLFLCFPAHAYAQNVSQLPGHILSRSEMNQIIRQNLKQKGIELPSTTLNNPSQLKEFISKNSSVSLPHITNNQKKNHQTLSQPDCIDSSFDKLNSINDNSQYVSSITHTKDDGVLMAGIAFNLNAPHLGWQTYGVLTKTDNMGNIIWAKIFSDPLNHQIYNINPTNVSELQNGDILVVASVDTAQGNTTTDSYHQHTLLIRLSSAGNMIWYKTYNSNMAVNDPYMPVDIRSINEAPNGDLILCGTTFDSFLNTEVIIRMDNAGNKLWDMNFHYNDDYSLGTEGINAFFENGNITVVGISFGISDIPYFQVAIHFLTLDYSSGQVLSKRFFIPDYTTDLGTSLSKSFSHYTNHCIKLNNGHYLVYGQPFSDFTQTSTPVDHFGVMEFDAGHNLVDSYTLTSNIISNYYSDNIYFDASGSGLFMLYTGQYPASNVFIGSIRKRQISKERMVIYPTGGIAGHGSFGPNQQFCFFNDGGYALCESYFENDLLANSYEEFRKMHDSDTSSVCLGSDSLTESIVPYNIKENPSYAYFGDTYVNQVNQTNVSISFLDTFTYNTKNPCQQKSLCDTLKIHGDTLLCTTSQPQLFSVYKSPLCGSFPQWDIDTNIISSMNVVNDTTLAIIFKNINWQGKIYASLFTGNCSLPLQDSLTIHVVISPKGISLGADTALCSGNTIVLHAGQGYSIYKWQDGSTDSLFTVKTTGNYWVAAKDYCNNSYSDTILISAASFPFTIGNDTVKCNQDTITLIATTGFNNYQWLSSYNIITSLTADTAKVFPLTDTSYIATAEKWPGCFVKDTIYIKAQFSPLINLGRDTSLCNGQSIILDAGTEFTSYQWNTGANSEKITVDAAGDFSVKATYFNECASFDTLKILKISPLPDFSLGNTDTTLCDVQQLKYNFNLQGASYSWNDGSSSGNKIISNAGEWWIKVTQDGCSKSDTINLAYKPSPIVQLGNDTTLCEGNTKLLNAENSSSTYVWQDGSDAPTYNVTKQGVYWVVATLNGCTANDSVSIAYTSKPHFSIDANTFMCDGQQMILHPDTDSTTSYLWQDGSTQSSYTANKAGLYYLTESNTCGSYTDSITIETGPCKLHMPSAFTPNNNGINDVFRVKYPFPVKQFAFAIFNRWGQKVFETNNINKGWNGKLNGTDQPSDMYVWMIYYTGTDDKKESAKGTVALIR